LKTIFELAPAERRLLLRSACVLPLLHCSVRLVGLKRTRDRLQRRVSFRRPRRFGVSRPDTVARLVRIAARRGPVRTPCLPESLLLWWLLLRRGFDPRIRIGVARGACFRAHAWVEFEGRALDHERSSNHLHAAFDRDFGSIASDAS
jgi:hypothetical protein